MSEFVFVYRNSPTNRSPEEMQQQMQHWMTWMKELGDKGHLKDFGHPLDRGGKVVSGSGKLVTDGPFAEKDIVSGYSIVEARDIEHAAELARECPIFRVNGLVEVRPVMKMNG